MATQPSAAASNAAGVNGPLKDIRTFWRYLINTITFQRETVYLGIRKYLNNPFSWPVVNKLYKCQFKLVLILSRLCLDRVP